MNYSPAATKQPFLGDVPAPWTLSFAFTAAAGDVAGLTSDGPPARVPIILVLLGLAFAQDCGKVLKRGHLQLGYFAPLLALIAWSVMLAAGAWANGDFSPDALVILVVPVALGLGLATSYIRKQSADHSDALAGRALATASIAYVALGGINALLSPQGTPPQGLSHERLFLLVLVFSLPWHRFGKLIRAATVLAAAMAVYRYPSATVLIALGFAGLVLVLLKIRHPGYRLVSFLSALLLGALLTAPAQTAVSSFYNLVGRVDNSSTREYLWAQATAVISDSPLWGGAFAVPITGFANINGQTQPVPFHNSFLTLGVAGGLVLVVLFVAVLITAYVARVNDTTGRGVAIGLLPALTAGIVTLSVNPTLDKFGTSVALYSLIAAALLRSSSQHIKATSGRSDRLERFFG